MLSLVSVITTFAVTAVVGISTFLYAQPGVYPVTLIVSDEAQTASFTQHITITGEAVERPALVLEAAEPEFRGRPVQAVDVYGKPPRFVPHTLFFTARPTRPKPYPKVLSLKNAGKGELPAAVTAVEYILSAAVEPGWLPEGTQPGFMSPAPVL